MVPETKNDPLNDNGELRMPPAIPEGQMTSATEIKVKGLTLQEMAQLKVLGINTGPIDAEGFRSIYGKSLWDHQLRGLVPNHESRPVLINIPDQGIFYR